MAYNKMKRKTIIVIFASLLSFVAIFPCAKYWGAVGCSFPIFLCIVITYGPILNKMYAQVIGINVRQFWIEILKMSLVPSLFVVAGLLILPYTDFPIGANWAWVLSLSLCFICLYHTDCLLTIMSGTILIHLCER